MVSARARSSEASGAIRISRDAAGVDHPACSIAETGVGAARVAGSQRWKGTCADRESAAMTTSTLAPGTSGPLNWPASRRSTVPQAAVALRTAAHSPGRDQPKAMAVRRTLPRAAAGASKCPAAQ